MTLPLTTILTMTGDDFQVAFYDYLVEKRATAQLTHPVEYEAYLLLSMLPWIYAQGFPDLFRQLYTASDCQIVEHSLHKLGLHNLATTFAEAGTIARNEQMQPTNEALTDEDLYIPSPGWQQIDRLGQAVLNADSEMYLIDERVENYVKAHADELVTGEHMH